jgi:hypothetical protein
MVKVRGEGEERSERRERREEREERGVGGESTGCERKGKESPVVKRPIS